MLRLCPAGFVAERTSSYDEPFYMTGALLIAASLLGFAASGWGGRSCRPPTAETTSNSYRRADSVDTQTVYLPSRSAPKVRQAAEPASKSYRRAAETASKSCGQTDSVDT